MPNSEWWHDHLAETEDGVVLDFVGVGDIPELLAEHRKRVVREVWVEIGRVHMALAENNINPDVRVGYHLAFEKILSLPCLKEKE